MIRIIFLLISFPLYATVFQMQPVAQQIQEADAIVIGHYLKKKSVTLEDGSVATQMIFKMDKEIGVQSDFFGMSEIIVHYPGGKVGDTHVKVEGVPKFVAGENVVLMIKSHKDRFWGMNLGFGTFKIINYGKDKLILNTLFPEDHRVSQVKLEEFERKVRELKGSSLKIVHQPIYPTETDNGRMPASIQEQGKNRAIASTNEEGENNLSNHGFNTMWLVVFLAAIGGIFRMRRQKPAR